MKIMVTGGAGYIGSHTSVELLENGYQVVVVDNLSNSNKESIERVRKITNKAVTFYEEDIRDEVALNQIFRKEKIDAVIHFAGLKAVGESNEEPIDYYINNVAGTLNLLDAMMTNRVKKIVFSSSATVYGEPASVPIKEDQPLIATNPYGRTKIMIEDILNDLYASDREWGIAVLRYFNPIGAHKSGLIGEDPRDIPNNLLPYVAKVADGSLECLKIFGDDYKTKDGTGIRDYIHVVDLAEGHISALKKIENDQTGIVTYNLGTGRGYSVFDVVSCFEKASGKKIPYEIVNRRMGDIPICFADATRAWKEMTWKATKSLDEMCSDAWKWQEMHNKEFVNY